MNILALTKHRYPFIMIDKIIDYKYMEYSTCIKNISNNEPWTMGHYPEDPVFPGVLLLEAMSQASLPLLVDEQEANHDKKAYLANIERAKFIQKIQPGDQVRIECKLVSSMHNYITIESTAFVEDKKVGITRLSFVLEKVKTND